MNKSVYTAVAAAFTLATASPAFAQQAGMRLQPPAEPLYFGLKAGAMDVDDTEDAASNVGIVAGYKFHEDERGAFFGEAEYTRTFSDGEANAVLGSGDYDVETLSAYGGFRSAGQIFWKAKAGLSWWDFAVDGAPAGTGEDDDISLSFGAGAGWRMNETTGIEAEYTWIDSDINFFSVGVFSRF